MVQHRCDEPQNPPSNPRPPGGQNSAAVDITPMSPDVPGVRDHRSGPREAGLRHALNVADERDASAELIARLSGSDRASELALRLGQSLEVTDGLWE
jgi:hypothetical protein